MHKAKVFDPSFLNGGNEVFIETGLWRFNYNYASGIELVRLDNALKTGATCATYRITVWPHSPADLINFWEAHGGTPEAVAAFIDSVVDESKDVRSAAFGNLTVHKGEQAGIRTFSPFALSRLKPLGEMPPKWTLRHAIRALVNGQAENVRCKSYFTDDYADDAARNFRQGSLDPVALARKVIERPDGWWTSIDKSNEVYLCCHHFDSNGFRLNLTAKVADKAA